MSRTWPQFETRPQPRLGFSLGVHQTAMGWNARCVVLLSHEYALGRACQVRRLQRSRKQEDHQQTAVEAVCAKVASSSPRKSDCSRITTRSCSREGAARTECRCSARREQAARQEGAAARRSCVASSSHNQFWGSVIFRAIWRSWRCCST